MDRTLERGSSSRFSGVRFFSKIYNQINHSPSRPYEMMRRWQRKAHWDSDNCPLSDQASSDHCNRRPRLSTGCTEGTSATLSWHRQRFYFTSAPHPVEVQWTIGDHRRVVNELKLEKSHLISNSLFSKAEGWLAEISTNYFNRSSPSRTNPWRSTSICRRIIPLVFCQFSSCSEVFKNSVCLIQWVSRTKFWKMVHQS